jgi:hypothetical protein
MPITRLEEHNMIISTTYQSGLVLVDILTPYGHRYVVGEETELGTKVIAVYTREADALEALNAIR